LPRQFNSLPPHPDHLLLIIVAYFIHFITPFNCPSQNKWAFICLSNKVV
jgi:hypothetical protein